MNKILEVESTDNKLPAKNNIETTVENIRKLPNQIPYHKSRVYLAQPKNVTIEGITFPVEHLPNGKIYYVTLTGQRLSLTDKSWPRAWPIIKREWEGKIIKNKA